jgi:spermidine/putrescine transport system permease protein
MITTDNQPSEETLLNMANKQEKPRFSWQLIFSLLMYVYMYLPIFILTFYSFNKSPYSAGWSGFTLEWYLKLFKDTRILTALQNSLIVGIIAVLISAVLGTLMAVGLAKYRFPGKNLYRGVAYLPLIIPDIAIAVATLVFLAAVGIRLSLWTIISAHVVLCIAYVALSVSSRINSINPHLEEAALDLGATPTQAFIQVLLPELMPSIIAGCLIAFVVSMDDFLLASFTAGTGATTLPMEIFSRIRTGVKPDINALSVMLMLFSGILAIIAENIRFKSEQQKQK